MLFALERLYGVQIYTYLLVSLSQVRESLTVLTKAPGS